MIKLLRALVPSNVWTLLITETIVIFSCFVIACFLVLPIDPVVYLLYDGGLGLILITTLTILLTLYLHDLYANIRVRSKMLLVQQVLQAVGVAFLFQSLLYYANTDLTLPRWVMTLGGGLSLIAITSWRLLYSGVVLRAFGEERIVFIGSGGPVREIVTYVREHPDLGLCIAGYIDEQPDPALDPSVPWLGRLGDLRKLVEQTHPDRLVVGLTERRGRTPLADLLELRFSGILIQEAAAASETMFKWVSLAELRPSQLIFAAELGPRPGIVALQVFYSRLIALIGLVVSSPILVLVAVAIKLSSRGPILFRQTRVGWQGRHFALYKFRSMREDAEAESGAVWASKNDPRVTSVGRWLRLLRLDELPQFINVLRGDMSIVGPRPERPEFVAILSKQIPFFRQRLCVRPGITGWAQINHKYGDTLEDAARKLEYDLYYIKHLSPGLDAYIVLQTLKIVLLQRGAQ
jgi:exopolysaccharide biosynthesis polyprenyl glycosylphosphotransferase